MEAIIQAIVALIVAHPRAFLGLLIGWPVFSAAVSSLPAPVEASGRFYKSLYMFLHLLAANPWRAYFGYLSGKNGAPAKP